ncbi:MAG TPA: ABC transporter permease [Chitinophagaceae bacterium]|nr:ABC transporter permease [Chitinophagaceae bacterium]
MIKNYFKTGFRNLWRNKNFTVINIAGLAVGIAVCLVIFLIIQFELSFDKFHPKKDRIYRVLTELHSEDGMHVSAGVPFSLPKTMHNDYPGLVSTAVFSDGNDQIILPDEKNGQEVKKFMEEKGVFFAEPAFFEIFNYPLLIGEYNSLKDPNTAVITKEIANKYFGDWHQAIGKTIKRKKQVYTITGILKTIPQNTDMQLKIVASYATLKSLYGTVDWVSVANNHCFYFLLPEGATQSSMDQQLLAFTKKYKKDDIARNIEFSQPLSQVHFDKESGNFLDRTVSKGMINALWMIAAFILLIACVNFVNLSTAQAVNRAKEIGVRKVLGGNKTQLRFQFFSEVTIIALLAVLLSVIITVGSVPYLNKILQLPFSFDIAQHPSILYFLFLITIAVIGLAGFYPAVVLSRFNPITAIRARMAARSNKGVTLRRGLVVFQFVIAQALIIGTLIIVRQMDLFRNSPVGFDKHAVLNVSFPDDSTNLAKLNFLHDELMRVKGVRSVSFGFGSPADNGNWYSNFRYNQSAKETDWSANLKWADASYLSTYNIPLVSGRNVQASDTVREYLVNETLVKRLGISDPAEVLNKQLDIWDGQMPGPIVGVIKDFNAVSLREGMAPVIISTMKQFYGKAGIKIEMAQSGETIKAIGKIWGNVYPEYVYEPKFLDTVIDNFYSQENRLSKLYRIFALLAIFLSCLGLYGLASFMAVQRVKEVGVRKVMGASVRSIIFLFSKEFIILISIAFVIAAPLAWLYMHDWLQDFVYRTRISGWILLLAGVSASVIALLTISVKAIQAAVANPIKSLRTE